MGRGGMPFGRGRGRGPGGFDPRQGGGGEMMMRRILGHGDLRYVILSLINDKPNHGYELIKALEEKSKGAYSPSPGVIYPTLTFLEEGGYVTATSTEGKKLFTITVEGKKLLEENREQIEAIFERFEMIGDRMAKLKDWFGKDEDHREEMKKGRGAIRDVMHALKKELFSMMPIAAEKQKKIAEILTKAIEEIRALKK